MHRGVIERLRNRHRWLVQAVALALLLPALIGLLPQPALSAEAALARDLMASVCGQDLPQQQQGGSTGHGGYHEHCVLCSTQAASCAPGLAAAMPAFAAHPTQPAEPGPVALGAVAPPLQARLDASPPRGPPVRA